MQFFPPEQYGGIGYGVFGNSDIYQETIRIYADIPNNFTVKSAYITLRHQPIDWIYYKGILDTNTTRTTGYARNVQIYKETLMARQVVYVDSERNIASTN